MLFLLQHLFSFLLRRLSACNHLHWRLFLLFLVLRLFSFCCLDWVISILISSQLLIHSSVSSNLLLILSSVLFISFFSYDWFFLIFSTSLFKVSLSSSILLSLVSIFMTISLNSLSSKLLVCFNRFFLEFHFVHLFRTYPSASSCC